MPEKELDRLHNRDNVKLATEAFNRTRKNQQWRVIEKQLENVLIHWRARIGMEKKQVPLNIITKYIMIIGFLSPDMKNGQILLSD